MKVSVLLTGLGLLGLTACQTMPYQPYARAVKQKPAVGGIIALKLESRSEDRKKADSMMKTNCGINPVKVLGEGEVDVGDDIESCGSKEHKAGSSSTTVASLLGLPIPCGSDSSETDDANSGTTSAKEWQISYECEVIKTATLVKSRTTKKVR